MMTDATDLLDLFGDSPAAPKVELPRVMAEGNYCILDIESTGLSRKEDQAVQVAFGQADAGVMKMRGFYWVKPTVPIKERAGRVHGFTMSGLQHSPVFADVAAELHAVIGDRVVLGYGAHGFDVPILARQFADAGIEWTPRVLDVLLWARKLLTGKHDLGTTAAALGVVAAAAHDAWYDCRMTWNIFGQLAFRFPEFGVLTPEAACVTDKK